MKVVMDTNALLSSTIWAGSANKALLALMTHGAKFYTCRAILDEYEEIVRRDFPRLASDAQLTQSQTYWSSAQPVAITEWGARTYSGNGNVYLYLRMKNSGAYPVRITRLVGGDGTDITRFGGGACGAPNPANISDYYYLAQGEEKYFGWVSGFGNPCSYVIFVSTGASTSYTLGGASSLCANSTSTPGTLTFNSMGFEYIEYLDNNQQITKRQIGKQVTNLGLKAEASPMPLGEAAPRCSSTG